MNYLEYSGVWLRFTTGVHFGGSGAGFDLSKSEITFCADTLFSALCHTAMTAQGEEGLQTLVNKVKEGSLRFSDGMPYKESSIYLPRPILPPSETVNKRLQLKYGDTDRKKMKRLKWIPSDQFTACINNNESFDPEKVDQEFGETYLVEKVYLREPGQSDPYGVGVYAFYENCGLFFIAGHRSQEDFTYILDLIKLAGMGGIGGKRTTGYGKYEIGNSGPLETSGKASEWINERLVDLDGKRFMTLSTALPKEEELNQAMDGAFYNLSRRSGFVQSSTYSNTALKKKTQFFFSAGSTFSCSFHGDLYDVSCQGSHPVYRYSMPLMMGVDV